MDFWISDWISGFHSGFLDFTVDFWISAWISGFQFGFLPTVYEISFVTDPSYTAELFALIKASLSLITKLLIGQFLSTFCTQLHNMHT